MKTESKNYYVIYGVSAIGMGMFNCKIGRGKTRNEAIKNAYGRIQKIPLAHWLEEVDEEEFYRD